MPKDVRVPMWSIKVEFASGGSFYYTRMNREDARWTAKREREVPGIKRATVRRATLIVHGG